MAGNELAKAYIALVPSLKGAQKSIERQLSGVDTTSAGKSMGEKAGSGFGGSLASAAKKGLAVVAASATAALAGVAAIGKSALDAYASYEQLVGGVDKLFGEASGKLQAYAARAYETSGMSANQYMEQATSFSAALINSLAGDTEKAADQADKAMRSMSDNVNVFGSRMEDVQNAFQGFAKQNYTMLDNLKLGYGGTKEEMQRLIDDANEYARTIGEASDLSIDSFSDIVDAIDLVQRKQNIAGTTAKEAATTIEGSLNMLRASWKNWLTELGKSDADMGRLTDELVASFESAAENVVPRIATILGTVLGSLPEIVAKAAPIVADALAETFSKAWETFSGSLPEDVRDKVAAAMENLSEKAERLSDAFAPVLESLKEAAGKVLPVVQSFLEHAADSLDEYLVPALEGLAPHLANLNEKFGELAGKLEPVAALLGDSVGPTVDFLAWRFGLLADAMSIVVEVLSWMMESFNQSVERIRGFIDGVKSEIERIAPIVETNLTIAVVAVASWAVKMGTEAYKAASGFVGNVAAFFATLPRKVSEFLDGVIAKLPPWAQDMARGAVEGAESFASSLLGELASLPRKVYQSGVSIVSGLIGGIRSMADSAGRAMAGVISSIAAYLPHSPAKKGALSGRGWSLYSGQAIPSALARGIEQAAALPQRAMAGVMRGVAGSAAWQASPLAGAAAGSGAAAGGAVYNITINADVKDFEGVRALDDLLDVLARARAVNPTRSRR